MKIRVPKEEQITLETRALGGAGFQ